MQIPQTTVFYGFSLPYNHRGEVFLIDLALRKINSSEDMCIGFSWSLGWRPAAGPVAHDKMSPVGKIDAIGLMILWGKKKKRKRKKY